jgi:5-formyltetrahydrofolate cyclo-ligase
MTDLPTLRRHLKHARAAIDTGERMRVSRRIVQRLARHPRYLKARRVAAYIGSKHEVDPMPLMYGASDLDKTFYLPVLHPFRDGRLLFCRWSPGDPLQKNRFDIPEPVPTRDNILPVQHLDLVIMPMLGFDPSLNRLGMGGGYYDRSLAFRRRRRCSRRPFLLGLAFEVQRIDHLERQPWDIDVDAVISEDTVYGR